MTDFREPTHEELALLNRLLSVDFPGRDELVEQLSGLAVSTITGSGDNYGSLKLKTGADNIAKVNRTVPVEAAFEDDDGVPIHILLHVVDGKMNELEIFKSDGSAMTSAIQADKLNVTTPEY